VIGREMIVLGLRAAVAAQGLHLEASMLGKWKATVQFVAIALVMLRPDVVIGGVFLDQWVLIAAAIVTVWSGIDYFRSFSSALRGDP
jgi:CDP-diacylglycerol--glycerol-3-phosphate 3-phosphatidyltransferase